MVDIKFKLVFLVFDIVTAQPNPTSGWCNFKVGIKMLSLHKYKSQPRIKLLFVKLWRALEKRALFDFTFVCHNNNNNNNNPHQRNQLYRPYTGTHLM